MAFKTLNSPDKFPYPYIPEDFKEKEKKILLQYFTNWDKPIFAIFNLPQEVIGAMFSRYSRSAKSVRRLFLDEFWNSELGIKNIKQSGEELLKAQDRTRNFYQKVFAEFGDDSVIQMGCVHIAFENISQIIGAKGIEDTRIGAAYIEKSTRYVDFGTKINGHYLFMEPKEIMSSYYADDFVTLNNELFDAYNKHLPSVIDYLSHKYPLENQEFEDTSTHKLVPFKKITNSNDKKNIQVAYQRALKAKALDTIRFFLPVTTVTNLGGLFTGQSIEMTLNKMLSSPYSEVRTMGTFALEELSKVAPNFLQNIDHTFGTIARNYRTGIRLAGERIANKYIRFLPREDKNETSLLDFDPDADIKLAAQILYTGNLRNISKKDILNWTKEIKERELKGTDKKWSTKLSSIIKNSLPDRHGDGINRRQKLSRAFEQVYAEVEFYDNIGTYKDLQRHRICTTERQFLHSEDIYIPEEYYAPELKDLYDDYQHLAEKVIVLQKKLIKTGNPDLVHAAEYVSILGNKIRFNIKANLRQWAFMGELRTIAGGHPTYRHAMQRAVKQIIEAYPFMKPLFTHVDWTKDYGLGRLKAEISTQRKLAEITNK